MSENQNNLNIDVEEQLANIRKLGAEQEKLLSEAIKFKVQTLLYPVIAVSAVITAIFNIAAHLVK